MILASSPAAAAAAVATNTNTLVVPSPTQLRATTWPLGKVAFSLLPLAGTYTRRATVMEELVIDNSNGKRNGKNGNRNEKIWTFDQVQGVVNVNVPVRMVVVKVCFLFILAWGREGEDGIFFLEVCFCCCVVVVRVKSIAIA